MGSQPAAGEDPDNKGMHFLDNLVAAPNRVGFLLFIHHHHPVGGGGDHSNP